MKGNRFLDALAGVIIGFILGTFYYLVSAKCLISGTIPVDGLLLPEAVQSEIIRISVKWGGSIGAIVGILGAFSAPITMPRGHMSKTISCTSFLVCTIAAFVMYGSQLWHMEWWKIAGTFFYVIVAFFLAMPIGQFVSFIEKIRE